MIDPDFELVKFNVFAQQPHGPDHYETFHVWGRRCTLSCCVAWTGELLSCLVHLAIVKEENSWLCNHSHSCATCRFLVILEEKIMAGVIRFSSTVRSSRELSAISVSNWSS